MQALPKPAVLFPLGLPLFSISQGTQGMHTVARGHRAFVCLVGHGQEESWTSLFWSPWASEARDSGCAVPQAYSGAQWAAGKGEGPGEEEGEQQEEEKETPFTVLMTAEGTDRKPAGGQRTSGIAGVLGAVPTVTVTTVTISNGS